MTRQNSIALVAEKELLLDVTTVNKHQKNILVKTVVLKDLRSD